MNRQHLSVYNRQVFKTYRKGQIAELRVELRAVEKGYIVSRPTTEARYDVSDRHNVKPGNGNDISVLLSLTSPSFLLD